MGMDHLSVFPSLNLEYKSFSQSDCIIEPMFSLVHVEKG